MPGPIRRQLASALRLPSLLSLLALAGCVHVNLPDHLVADTVDAGKDLYQAIEGAVTGGPKATFVHTCVRESGAAVEEVERACLDELVARTKAQLKVDTLDYAVGDRAVGALPGSIVVSCQISLKG